MEKAEGLRGRVTAGIRTVMAPLGTLGNVWRHFCSSPLGWRGRKSLLASGGQGCC